MAEFRHPEAFCLMWYECQDCGHRERVWNSRDGVTPFGFMCSSCGKTVLHVDWKADERAPDYKPVRGQHIFRDGTPDDAEKIMRRRIDACKGTEYEIKSAREVDRLVEAARSGEEMGEFQKGWPMLDVAP